VVEYHQELQRAGVPDDALGSRPTREGWRIKYSGATRSVVEGPFVEATDQIAGYTIIRVRSREEAMGSQLTERLGDREWMSLLREHNAIVRARPGCTRGSR
jgi:hypothetical protein